MDRIECFADIWCPFAHVGLRALAGRRHEHGRDDVCLWIRAWPLELVNGAPQDVEKTAEHVAVLREQCEPGLFAGFDPAHFPRTTRPALALAARAYRVDARTGERVSFALRDALFEEGRDISEPEVLRGIAAVHGCPPAEAADEATIQRDWDEGKARGVRGSPHFFGASGDAFCPYLDLQRDAAGQLDVRENLAALDAFLDGCWAG